MENKDKSIKMDGSAMRYNTGKMDWSLVDFVSLEPLAEAMMYGADKYERDNWKKGQSVDGLKSSLLRHVFAYIDGEDFDIESGVHHLGHALANIMMTLYQLRQEANINKLPSNTLP